MYIYIYICIHVCTSLITLHWLPRVFADFTSHKVTLQVLHIASWWIVVVLTGLNGFVPMSFPCSTRDGKHLDNEVENIGNSPFFMGKSTISTGLCSIAMLNYQRVIFHEPEMLGHFGMIPLINHDSRLRSQWVRYNLPRSHSFIVWKNTKQEKLEVYTKLRNLETLRRIRISSNSHPGNGISIVLRIAILARCSHYALC